MGILTDKGCKLQFMIVAAALILFAISGQLIVKHMAGDYKQNMISHDYGIAGYLARHEPKPDKIGIAQAFTSEKTDADVQMGQQILQASGYAAHIRSSLLPEVEGFHLKFAVIAFVLSVLSSGAILLIILYFMNLNDKRIKRADACIQRFMSGEAGIRLDDHEEGSLSRLFTAVNTMATSLTAHIAIEKQNKQFLKDTISDISHQLKTPLAALKMYNEIMHDEITSNDAARSFISKSRRELDRMETLILNLLKLARLDAGSIELDKSRHDMKDFLEECIEGFGTRAESENKSIVLECDRRVALSFDEEWLMEAVTNIIKNAFDHTHAGGRIEVRCHETPVIIEITIKDDGAGIHPDDIHHIFKRFYRSRFSKDNQGAGIGLALSKAIIEKHGGTVTVESEPGRGAIFRLVFPKLSNL